MNLSKFSLLVFTLSLIFISHSPLQTLGESLYESLCNEAYQDKARCLEILKQDSRIAGAKNNNELSKFVLELALKKGIDAQNFLKEVMKTNPSPAIKECATTFYDEVVESFKSSLGELAEDGLTSSYDAKVAGDGPSTCDKAMKETKVTDPSIIAFNRDMLLLSKLAFKSIEKI